MTSQSLYRKWRSQTFSDLVGQEAIVRTLKNALAQGNPSHAYLFTGPRGTGKTSTARLLAKTINCLNPKDGEPCNVCQQCREITSGNSFNVIEIDAASNRGIDSIRELREKVMMPPSVGKYKVYILDEAHMLTTEAFNALLKTLEEPPKHAIFVMATTDVHKMLPTVLSRCQRFDFKRITTRQIVSHLNYVAEQEHVAIEGGAAELIARAAAGGMRDALSLLDQAIAYSGQAIALTQVQAMLGVADPRAIQKFVSHIAQLDSAGGLHLIHELAEAGADLRQINNQIAEYWRALMLAKAGADIATILDRTEDEVREIQQVMQLFNLEELTECARIFAQNELMQKNQGTPQLGLELALLACLELHRRVQPSSAGAVPTTPTTPAPTPTARPMAAASHPRQQPTMAAAQPRPTAPSQQATHPTPPASPTQEPSAPAQELPHTLPEVPVTHVQGSAANEQAVPPIPVSATEKNTPSQREPQELVAELPEWDALSYTEDEDEFEGAASPAPTTVASAAINIQPAELITTDLSAATPAVDATNSQLADLPTMTLQEVKDVWEMVKRRIKTKKDGALVAAVLNDYSLLAVEGTKEIPVLVIKANAKFHYDMLQKAERDKYIEWALKMELNQECRVKILPPGTTSGQKPTIPPPAGMTPRDTGMRASNQTASPPAQSAYRERPPTEPPRTPSARGPETMPLHKPEPREQQATPAPAPTVHEQAAPPTPLARTNVVRENRESSGPVPATGNTSAPKETRIEVLSQKAKNDPVVQEVVRIFKASIKEVYPK